MKNIDEVKVEGTSFVRDIKSMGLSNLDLNSRNEYYSKVEMLKRQKSEINTLREEVGSLKNDLQEIKTLMSQLLGTKING